MSHLLCGPKYLVENYAANTGDNRHFFIIYCSHVSFMERNSSRCVAERTKTFPRDETFLTEALDIAYLSVKVREK